MTYVISMATPRIISIIIALFFLLALRFFSFYHNQPQYYDGQQISLQVALQEEPEVTNHGQRFTIKTEKNQMLSVKTSTVPRYHYGDRLAIRGTLQVKKNPKGRTFFSLAFPKIQLARQATNPLIEASVWIRESSTRLYQETLPPTSASLLLGIVFGAKENFPSDFLEHLRTTGVLHVIAASGMNVSFFTGAVMFSLGTFLKRRSAIILSVFAVIFYSMLVGFEPSILRASIMAIIAFAASFFGRQQFAVFSLFVTGCVMLLWQPSFLFDVGFQLSCLSTLGILVIKPWLPLRKLGGFGEDIGTTIAAQIATFPVLLGVFGRVGVLSVLVNALVLWTVPILMLLGSLAVLFGLIFVPLGKLFLFLSLPFLLFFEQIVSFFGSFGWNVEVTSFPWQLSLGYYLLLGSLVLIAQKRKIS